MMDTQHKIIEGLNLLNQSLGVISTVNDKGTPESTSIFFIHDEGLTLYFLARKGSRKYKNISKNPHVSFVVTSQAMSQTLQLEGLASEVTDTKEEIAYFSKLVALTSEQMIMPPVSQSVGGEMAFMKITTTWARFGNFEVMKEGNKYIESVF